MARRLLLLTFLVLLGGLPASAARAGFFAPETIDGPSASVGRIGGVDLGRDGTGALVWLRTVAGDDHVFASRIVDGVWSPPEQLDAGLAGPSSEPTVAAGLGGEEIAAWVSGGRLYVARRPSPASPWTAPLALYDPGAGATVASPSIGFSIHGKGYVSFVAPGAGGHDVRIGRYVAGRFSMVPGALDVDPSADAGAGTGRPRIAVAADGVAAVAWGEAGVIYVRRVFNGVPSAAAPRASVPGPAAELGEVATANDDSFVDVTFRQSAAVGLPRSGLMSRLRGGSFESPLPVDGQSGPAVEDAGTPRIAMSGTGRGVVAVSRASSNGVWASILGTHGYLASVTRLDVDPAAGPSFPVPAVSAGDAELVAWQQDMGNGAREVLTRFQSGKGFEGEQVISDLAGGATDAAGGGLEASADGYGDMAVAFEQGAGPTRRVVVAPLDHPPGRFGARSSQAYQRSRRPFLAWGAARELWGPLSYTVTLDGAVIATTSDTQVRVPVALADGAHRWTVTATDRRGQRSNAAPVLVRVDGTAPVARLRLGGSDRAGAVLKLGVTARDLGPPTALGTRTGPSAGVRDVRVQWGDGSAVHLKRGARHSYDAPGRYVLRARVLDAAGNVASLRRRLIVRP